jgi:hypothetical protein
MTTSSAVALKHLQHLKPGDGWSIQEKKDEKTLLLRLLRRGVQLTDNYFLDIYYDGEHVVGILSVNAKAAQAQAQILVDGKGQPVRGVKLKTVSWEQAQTPRPKQSSSSSSSSESSSSSSLPSMTSSWTPEQHRQLWLHVGGFLVSTILIRLVFQTMFVLYICAFPLLYIYLVNTCPSEASFDAKKEMKRVLRGAHLPDDDPNKPKGLISETLARINASLATEVATGLGYEVTLTDVAGAVRVACLRVPAAKMDFYWVGALKTWYYVYSMEIPSDKAD